MSLVDLLKTESKDAEKLSTQFDFYKGTVEMIVRYVIESCNLVSSKNKERVRKWEETTISANIIKHFNELAANNKLTLIALPEIPDYDSDIYSGKKKTIEANKYDIYIIAFTDEGARFEIGIEAKILIENDFLKRKVNKIIRDYVIKGMDKFIDGRYSKEGFMIGYVVDGKIENIVKKLNKYLNNRKRNNEILRNEKIISLFVSSFESSHLMLFQKELKNLSHLVYNFHLT